MPRIAVKLSIHRGRAATLLAPRDVAKTYGIANLAEDTKLAREALYPTLSKDGNPRLTTLLSLLDALELKLFVTTESFLIWS
jgi:probable addiction module antidote protein